MDDVDRQRTTSHQLVAQSRALLQQRETRHREAFVLTYLRRKIRAIEPGQEHELDAVERELDGWLVLNHQEHYGPLLRRQIAAHRTYLAARARRRRLTGDAP